MTDEEVDLEFRRRYKEISGEDWKYPPILSTSSILHPIHTSLFTISGDALAKFDKIYKENNLLLKEIAEIRKENERLAKILNKVGNAIKKV